MQEDETMYIIQAPCWKCEKEMNVAVIRGNGQTRKGSTSGPESFDDKEIRMAEKNGVLIKNHYSETMMETYKANTCPSCGTFVGQFYLFSNYYNPAEMGTYKYKSIESFWN